MPQSGAYSRNDAKTGFGFTRSLGAAVAAVVVAFGVVAVTIPEFFIAIRTDALSQTSIYSEAALRIVVGFVLMLAASQSQSPGTLRSMGAAVLVVGMVTPLFGVEGARERLAWEASHITFFRFEGILFVLLGAMIVSLILPRSPINHHQPPTVNGH